MRCAAEWDAPMFDKPLCPRCDSLLRDYDQTPPQPRRVNAEAVCDYSDGPRKRRAKPRKRTARGCGVLS